MSAFKQKAVKLSLITIKQIFEQADVSGLPITSRCRILNAVAKLVKPSIHHPLITTGRNVYFIKVY